MVLGLHWRVWEYSTCNSLLKGNVRFDPAMTVNYESVNWLGRTEEIIKRIFNAEQRQRIIQSAQRTVESVGQTISEMMETAPLPQISPLTPQPEVRSIRPPSSRRNESNRER